MLKAPGNLAKRLEGREGSQAGHLRGMALWDMQGMAGLHTGSRKDALKGMRKPFIDHLSWSHLVAPSMGGSGDRLTAWGITSTKEQLGFGSVAAAQANMRGQRSA